jgi:hypothetical protein
LTTSQKINLGSVWEARGGDEGRMKKVKIEKPFVKDYWPVVLWLEDLEHIVATAKNASDTPTYRRRIINLSLWRSCGNTLDHARYSD